MFLMHIEFDNLVYPYDFACWVIPLNYKLEDRLFQTSYVECNHKFHTRRTPVFPWKLSSRSIKLYICFGPSEAYSLIFITQYIHFGPSKAYSGFMIEKNIWLLTCLIEKNNFSFRERTCNCRLVQQAVTLSTSYGFKSLWDHFSLPLTSFIFKPTMIHLYIENTGVAGLCNFCGIPCYIFSK